MFKGRNRVEDDLIGVMDQAMSVSSMQTIYMAKVNTNGMMEDLTKVNG